MEWWDKKKKREAVPTPGLCFPLCVSILLYYSSTPPLPVQAVIRESTANKIRETMYVNLFIYSGDKRILLFLTYTVNFLLVFSDIVA